MGGYAQITVNRSSIYIHRLAYELVNGPIDDGMCVCHSCDNPRCVNPSHLWLGTQLENIADRVSKGRNRVSEKKVSDQNSLRPMPPCAFPKAKKPKAPWRVITAQEAQIIRDMYAAREITMRELGKQFNVSRTTVYHIVHGQTWKQA